MLIFSFSYDLIMIGVKRIVRYFSGFHTDHISKIMMEYKPVSEEDIIDTLKKIEIKKVINLISNSNILNPLPSLRPSSAKFSTSCCLKNKTFHQKLFTSTNCSNN